LQEIKILILLLGAAFSAAFLFRLAFGEFRYFRPLLLIWAVCVVLAVVTKSLWAIYFFLFGVKLLYARNDPLTNMALYLGLLPVFPYNYFLSVLRPLGSDVLQLNTPFVLSLLFLVPLLPKVWRGREEGMPTRKGDLFFLVFLAMFLVACFRERYEFQITLFSGLRDAMEVLFSIGVPYFVLSRLIKDIDEFKTLMKAIALSGLMVVIYVYIEGILQWKIYNTVAEMMGIFDRGAIYSMYEIRHGLLRVSGTMDHPIALGIYLTFALGVTLYLLLQEEVRKSLVLLIVLLMAGAIYMTVSRGAWAGLVLMIVIFFLFKLSAGPRRVLMAVAIIGGLVSSFFFFNPARTHQPVGGIESVDEYGTLDYRIKLFKTAIHVIPDQFWFGSRTYKARPDMQKLKQGQGIIDIVNGYLWIALEMGMIALFAFTLVLLRSLYKMAWMNQLGEELENRNLKILGVTLFATIVSIAVQFASMSLTGFVQIYLFLILALARAAQHIATELEEESVEAQEGLDEIDVQVA